MNCKPVCLDSVTDKDTAALPRTQCRKAGENKRYWEIILHCDLPSAAKMTHSYRDCGSHSAQDYIRLSRCDGCGWVHGLVARDIKPRVQTHEPKNAGDWCGCEENQRTLKFATGIYFLIYR